MNTFQMNYFLTTVKYLNMTEAAQHLNISQSALSRSIATMEQELDVQMFVRDKGKTLRLTPEGAVIYQRLQKIYQDYSGMLQEVDNMKRRITGTLRIGYLEGQMIESDFRELILRFTDAYPDLTVDLTRGTEKELVLGLQDGSLDAAVMMALQLQGADQDILSSSLFWLPTYMIASKNHPFAGREDVSLRELKEDTFVYIENEGITDELLRLCRQNGFEPEVKYVKNIREQALALEMGKGIAGYNKHHSTYYSPNVATFRVKEIPDAQFVLAWNKNNYNPAIALLNKFSI